MICIGLTGGIGSGKSYIAVVFQNLGIPVYNADIRAKAISNNHPVAREKIVSTFGKEAYKNEFLDSRFIGELVFPNTQLLNKLNEIIHPLVEDDFIEWCDGNKTAPYLIKEAAILFETGSYKKLDASILVTAPEKVRIERILKREGMKIEDIRNRMRHQWNDEDKLNFADFVINNEGGSLVLPQVIKIHQEIINKEW